MTPWLRKCLALGLALTSASAMAQAALPAYNTYQAVPFVLDAKSGMAADLVAYLNAKLKGKQVFELQTMPRERLNQEVINNPDFKGVVLFLNPAFVGDADKKKYAWTPAFMQDGNQVISNMGKKVEYSGPDSLKGLTFQGIRGNKYAGLEERFGKDIKRADVNAELQVLKIIANDRADVTVMAGSMYNYLFKVNGASEGLAGKLHVSATPHLKFDRFMFVSNSNTALLQELSALATAMPADPAWKAILAKYGLN